jgi:hypothetical protein
MRVFAASALVAATVLGAAACSPAALAPEEIVPAFIAASQAGTRTMHMEWQGTVATGETGLPGGAGSSSVNGVFDFNGPDYAGTMTTGLPGSISANVSYARVGGASFVNYADSGWQRSDVVGATPGELDPMVGLTAADVTYEGLQDLDGRQVHRVRVRDPLAAVKGMFGGLGGFGTPTLIPGGESEYLIYVDATGAPVGAHVVLDMTMGVPFEAEATNIDYSIRWNYTFTLWGEPVTISAPTVVGGGGGIDDFPQPPPLR